MRQLVAALVVGLCVVAVMALPTGASAATCHGTLQKSTNKRTNPFTITCSAPYDAMVFMDQVTHVTAARHTCVTKLHPQLDPDGTTIPFTRCTPKAAEVRSISGILTTTANCGDPAYSGKHVVAYGSYISGIATTTMTRLCGKPKKRPRKPKRPGGSKPGKGKYHWKWRFALNAKADVSYTAPWVGYGYDKSVGSGRGSFDEKDDVRAADGSSTLGDRYLSGYENLEWSLRITVTGGGAYLDNQYATSVRLDGKVSASSQSGCPNGSTANMFLFDTKQVHGSKDYIQLTCRGADTAYRIVGVDIHRA